MATGGGHGVDSGEASPLDDMCDDLSPLYDQLCPARTTWFNIGLKLNINSDDLSAINVLNSKPPDICLREMLTERLHSGGPLSWRDVCDCLRSSTVKRNDVAEKIEEWRIGMMSKKQSITTQFPYPLSETGLIEFTAHQTQYEASPGPNFICPYCQKCTLEQYLSKNSCPKATGETLFPYLNTPALSDEDRSILEATLRKDTQKMIELFASTDTSIAKNLREDVAVVKNFVLDMISSLDEKHIAKLELADTIPSIFVALRPYKSFLNYKIVNSIVLEFGSENDKMIMKDYVIAFDNFCKRSAFEIPRNTFPSLPKSRNGTDILTVKLTSSRYSSLGDVISAKDTIASIFDVNVWTFHLCSIEDGCLCLRFLFSAKAFAKLFPPTVSQLASLCEAGISIFQDAPTTVERTEIKPSTVPEDTMRIVDDRRKGKQLEAEGHLNSQKASSVSSLDSSGMGSTCSEADNETSDGEEADIDTTDIEYTFTGPGSEVEVTYNQILNTFCETKLELQEEMDLDVSPCSLWKALHNGQQCMALVYNGEGDKLKFTKYIEDVQKNKPNVMPAKCIHFDTKLYSHPVVLFEVQQPLKEYCFSSEALSEIQQLSLLLNAAISVLGFSPNITLQLTTESLFVQKSSTNDTNAMFLPIYEQSYFHQLEPKIKPEVPSLNWLNDSLLLMVHHKQCNSNSKLPENHILFNIFKHRWFPDDKLGSSSTVTADVAKELEHILELEKTRLEMKATLDLADSEYLEVPHLHMLLIGHTGVGKTSIRKHLQNIPFNDKEKSTIIMEQELLYQETFESTIDSKKSAVVFKKYDSVYKSDPDNIYLTLWDTGGQPMFQDLLPCFAKFRSIYGIVVRLCDLLDNSNASIRPTCPLEIERESPYTYTDYLYRCLSFLDSNSLDVHLSNLPDILKKRVFELASGTVFPKIAFIGTFKDQIKIDDKQDLDQMLLQLKLNLNSLKTNFHEKIILPSASTPSSVMFEIDNTQSGAKYDDPGMKILREQIISCTKSAKAKIPRKWVAFKIDLERESRLQQPCTGIVTFEKASEIAKKCKTDLRAALCYFHELGIFIWYHDKKRLQEYVFVEPKNLLSILGTILDPQVYKDHPKQWKSLQTRGILNVQVGKKLLEDSKTGLPLSWILNFFDEHHLAMHMPLLESYFIPSMLQVLPICPNHQHVFHTRISACSVLPNHQHVFGTRISACSVLPAELQVAPLFLVPISKFIPPGFFPRLMTVLSGIKKGIIIWKLSPNFINCKNMVSFEINNQFRLVFTEFIDCVRAHFDGLTDDNIPQPDLCLQIVSTLNVQLQRVINAKSMRLTFVCSCSEHSCSIHFLKYLPFATDNHIPCGEHTGKQMELTAVHKIWLTDEHHPKIATLEDAEARFGAAMEGSKFGVRFTTILFTGLPESDVYAYKRLIMDKNVTPFESMRSLDSIQPGPANFEFSCYTVSGKHLITLQDDDLDMVFACNAAVQTPKIDESDEYSMQQGPKEAPSNVDTELTAIETPKGAENDKSDKSVKQEGPKASSDLEIVLARAEKDESDKHSIQQRPEGASSENPENNPSKQEKPIQSVGKEVPRSIPAGNSPQHLTSIIYEPISKNSILKCVSSKKIMQLMVNRDRSLTTDFDNLTIINCVCCSDVWLLDVLPIFLQGIAIGINSISMSQYLEKEQDSSVSGDKIQVTSKQLLKDISVLATKLLVVGKHAEVESIESNERMSEIIFRDIGQAKFITDEDGKQAIFEVGISRSEIENIEQHLVSSLALIELKQVSLSWHMLGHAIKKVMRQYNRKFISKQEVLIIATKFRLSNTDLELALLNLHMSGLILYYGNVLPNVIFKDSIVLIELIAQINLYAMQHNQGAIIPLTAFEACEKMYGGLFTCKEAMSLFKDLHILTELETSLFLMPCLLRGKVSVETLSSIFSANDTKVAPLVIQCSLSRGIFEYIMCYLCSQCNSHPWPWKIKAPQFRVFKNCVQFILPGLNVLITLYRQENTEMTVYVTSMQDYEILPSIRAAIVNGLNKAAEAFHISSQAVPVVGFHCTCGQVNYTHMIVPSTEDHWRCSATNEILALLSVQEIWFINRNGADTLTVHNVFAVLIPWSNSWYKVGIFFKLENDVLETITVQYRQDTDAALMEVIRKWFHTHHNPSWKEVQQVFLYLKQSDTSLIERYMTEDVFKECLPSLILFVSISTLLPYLLKYRLVHMADVDSVQSLYLDNLTKITNLFNLTKRNGGENGFDLLYDCLFNTSEEHRGHDEIVQELKRCAPSSSTITGLNPIAMDPSILESPDAKYAVESVDALIKEISDHIGQDWMVLARGLGFTETDIQSIEYADKRDLKEQICQFFYEWKQRNGQDATRDTLVTVLYESGLNEVLNAQTIDIQNQTYLKKLDELMADKSGTIELHYLKTYFIGPSGLGKTTTRQRLVGSITNLSLLPEDQRKRCSTLLAEYEQVLVFVDKSGTKLEFKASSSLEEETQFIFSYLMSCEPIEDSTVSNTSPPKEQPTRETTDTKKQTQLKIGEAAIVPKETVSPIPGPTPNTVDVGKVVSRLRSIVSSGEYSKELLNKFLLNLVDIGGQPGFVEMFPFLNKGPGIFLVFFRLDKDFDDMCQISYERGYDKITPYDSTYTNRETLSQILSAISHYTKIDSDIDRELCSKLGNLGSAKPVATLIGTFKDKLAMQIEVDLLYEKFFASTKAVCKSDSTTASKSLNEHEQKKAIRNILTQQKSDEHANVSAEDMATIEQIVSQHLNSDTFKKDVENRLEQKLTEKNEAVTKITSEFENLLSQPKDKKFIAVDNYEGTDSDMEPLREHLHGLFNSYFKDAKLRIRPQQLLFGAVLRKEFDIVSMEECIRIGTEGLKMREKEVRFTIWYLDRYVGSLIYHPEIKDRDGWFGNFVICDPQVVFNSLSVLVVNPLLELHSEDSRIQFKEAERRNWILKGQFSLKTITRCLSEENQGVKKDQLIPVEKLLILLEHSHLLAKITTVEEGHTTEKVETMFFIPAILKCASREELTKPPPTGIDTPPPIKITFDPQYVPVGIFCAMISELVSRGSKDKGIVGMTWKLATDTSVKRNLVSFHIDNSAKHFVTLIAHVDCYEIRIIRQNRIHTMHELCSYVLLTLLLVMKDISPLLSPIIAFDCYCGKHEDGSKLCLLTPGVDPCFKCTSKVSLSPHQECWFAEEVSVGDDVILFALPFASDRELRGKSLSFEWSKRRPRIRGTENELEFKASSNSHFKGFISCKISKNQKHFFTVYHCLKESVEDTSSSETDQPQFADVKEVIKEIRSDWYSLAIELDIDYATRKSLEKDYRWVEPCFEAMLTHWVKRSSPPPSWSALVRALESPTIARGDIATTIKQTKATSDISPGICHLTHGEGLSVDHHLRVVRTAAWEVRGTWRPLGEQLGVNEGTLDAIKRDYPNESDMCFTKLLEQWLTRSTPAPTLGALIQALESPVISRGDFAQQMESKLT